MALSRRDRGHRRCRNTPLRKFLFSFFLLLDLPFALVEPVELEETPPLPPPAGIQETSRTLRQPGTTTCVASCSVEERADAQDTANPAWCYLGQIHNKTEPGVIRSIF